MEDGRDLCHSTTTDESETSAVTVEYRSSDDATKLVDTQLLKTEVNPGSILILEGRDLCQSTTGDESEALTMTVEYRSSDDSDKQVDTQPSKTDANPGSSLILEENDQKMITDESEASAMTVEYGKSDDATKQVDTQLLKTEAFPTSILTLAHACQCGDEKCSFTECHIMKRVLSHAKTCKLKMSCTCTTCNQLYELSSYHAEVCQETVCPVPFCLDIKQEWEEDELDYYCNHCEKTMEKRYHCTVCDDFDLCIECFKKDGHAHIMQKMGFELGEDQSNPQESRKLIIQRHVLCLEHVYRCNACRLPSCQKMKRIVAHGKKCKRKSNGVCSICKQIIALTCYHAKNCQDTKCPLSFCLNIKNKMKQVRIAQQQILKRMATTQNRGMTEAIRETSPGSSNQTNQPSLNKPLTSSHVPQPGIEIKPSACPPVGALQAVQAAATSQSAPHMVASTRPAVPNKVRPGNNMVNRPTANRSLMRPPQQQQQQHMQKSMTQMLPGQPNRMMGMRNVANSNFSPNMQPQDAQPGPTIGSRPPSQMMGPNNMPNPAGRAPGDVGLCEVNSGTPLSELLQQRSRMQFLQRQLTSLKSCNLKEQKQQVLQILKANPLLMAEVVKQRAKRQAQLQQVVIKEEPKE